MNREISQPDLLKEAYTLFHEGLFFEASELLDRSLINDLENTEIKAAMKACEYWKKRKSSIETLKRSRYERS